LTYTKIGNEAERKKEKRRKESKSDVRRKAQGRTKAPRSV
jgi:hypothetical protein